MAEGEWGEVGYLACLTRPTPLGTAALSQCLTWSSCTAATTLVCMEGWPLRAPRGPERLTSAKGGAKPLGVLIYIPRLGMRGPRIISPGEGDHTSRSRLSSPSHPLQYDHQHRHQQQPLTTTEHTISTTNSVIAARSTTIGGATLACGMCGGGSGPRQSLPPPPPLVWRQRRALWVVVVAWLVGVVVLA